MVAAVVALLNDARLAKNLPPLGFLNPLLYSKGVNGFNDITEGNNVGCGTLGFNVRFFCLGLLFLTAFPSVISRQQQAGIPVSTLYCDWC